jgi:hypothetical protein
MNWINSHRLSNLLFIYSVHQVFTFLGNTYVLSKFWIQVLYMEVSDKLYLEMCASAISQLTT